MIQARLFRTSLIGLCLLVAPPAGAATWDVAADWSAVANPFGAWTYGWADTWMPGYAFTTYDTADNVEGLERWRTAAGPDPCVAKNPLPFDISASWGHTYPTEQCMFHPGPNGEHSTYRWTAPADGIYDIDMTVSNLVNAPNSASTQCYAVVNSSLMILGATVDADNSSTDLKTRQLALSAGDTIDFMVNPCGSHGHDSTGLALSITEAAVAVGTSWDVYEGFSLESGNPNGVWTYGSTPNLETGYSITNYTTTNTVENLDVWNPGVSDPCVGANRTGSPLECSWGASYPTGSVMLSPGPNAQYSLFRWTAPESGTFMVTADFFNVVTVSPGATTDVLVMKNASEELFRDDITAWDFWANCCLEEIALADGDTIDFVLGDGGNGHGWDNTGLRARILKIGGGSGRIEGDLNGDGAVGSADLDIVRANWGSPVAPGNLAGGDPSGDGFVGSPDLDIVRANWGRAAAAAVPEPNAAPMLLVPFGAFLSGRRRVR